MLPAPEGVSDGEVVERALGEADFAEANGFDSVWIAEHHLSSFGLVGAPSVYAAAVAQRTRRIEIGYAVAVVPLHHPIRLAEEIAWVSHLSRGRTLVGMGPGFSPFEFTAYGVALEERHERLEEGSAVLRGLLGGGTFTHTGKHWDVPPVELRPRPFGGQAPPFLHAISGEQSLLRAAALGEPLLFGLKPLSEIAAGIALYRSVRSRLGASSESIDNETSRFRVLRRIVVAACEQQALADARRALAREAEPGSRVLGGCVGSPETVLEGLRAVGRLGIRRVIAWLNFGDLPHASARRSRELLAREVMPRLAVGGATREEMAS